MDLGPDKKFKKKKKKKIYNYISRNKLQISSQNVEFIEGDPV